MIGRECCVASSCGAHDLASTSLAPACMIIMALFKSSLALWCARLVDLGRIKTSSPIVDELALLLVLLLLLWEGAISVSLQWSILRNSASLHPSWADQLTVAKGGSKHAGATSGDFSNSKRSRSTYWVDLWLLRINLVATISMMILGLLLALGQVERIYAASSSTGVLNVFEVYQPVTFAPKSDNGCSTEVLLMDHVFGESYGVPFVGKTCPNSLHSLGVVLNMVASRKLRASKLQV